MRYRLSVLWKHALTGRRSGLTGCPHALTLVLALAVSVLGGSVPAHATASFVYHERTVSDATEGSGTTTCVGVQPYLDRLTPTDNQTHPLRFKVEYQFFTDTLVVYYTTDGSDPAGAFGVASGTTQLAGGSYLCLLTNGTDVVDLATATLPAQPAGTTVKYIIGAFHSGGGDEIFANSGDQTSAGGAAVFQYTVIPSSPAITGQPLGQTNLLGSDAAFAVEVTGESPFAYQWYFNSVNALSDATNAVLSINGVEASDQGDYSVVITNAFGSVTSSVAALTVSEFDFGDAPDPGFPTLLVHDGARHLLGSGLRLGGVVDGEADGYEDFIAMGDDLNGEADEDGVFFRGPLVVGQQAVADVVVVGSGLLNAWIDFDGNGSWGDPGERIFTNEPMESGTNTLVFGVPGEALASISYARFRLSSVADLGYAGPAPDGEVEDSFVQLLGSANLVIEGSADRTLAAVGETTIYSLVLSNSGPSRATAVSLIFTPAPNILIGTGTSIPGPCVVNGGNVVCNLNAMTNGAQLTARLEITSTVAQLMTNRFRIVGSENDIDPLNSVVTFQTLVLEPVAIVGQPQSQTVTNGGLAVLSVAASGTGPLVYQWRSGGEAIAGAAGSVLEIPDVTAGDAGVYDVVVSNGLGEVASDPALLTVLVRPEILVQPGDTTVEDGSEAVFVVVAAGDEPLRYQWRFEGVDISGETNSSLMIPDAQPVDEGQYAVVVSNDSGMLLSDVATLTVRVVPKILAQPVSLVITQASDATFSVMAMTAGGPLTYQWRLDGVALGGETNASHTVTNAEAADEGGYTVVVALPSGSVTSAVAQLTVLIPATVVQGPISQVVTQGSSATFSVTVAGDAPFTYQWRIDGLPIIGAVGPALMVTRAGPGDVGGYDVVVSNGSGSETSAVATLTVLLFPTIAEGPSNITRPSGSTFSIGVVAAGPEPYTYQWQKNGVLLPAQTGSSLQFAGALPSDSANYRVVVANNYGAVTSGVAVVVVQNTDFGDAPSSYPVLLANNGARHVIVPGLLMGAQIDAEADAQSNGTADGDDLAGLADEDGVVFADELVAGVAGEVEVTVSGDGFLQGWIDFDGGGSWTGPGERVFTNQAVVAGVNVLGIAVPGGLSGNVFARFRFSTVSGLGFDGPAPDGEVEDYLVTIRTPVDLAVSLSDVLDPVGVLTNVTYNIVVTNRGTTVATGVVLRDPLPHGMAFVSGSSSQGSCLNNAGVIECQIGTLNPGGRANISFTFRPSATGTKENVVTVSSLEVDVVPGNNTATETTSILLVSPQITNLQFIQLPEDAGPANVYPSTIFVSGLTTTVQKVTVTLHNVSHSYPSDLDILLVEPGGAGILLMSDAGGDEYGQLANVTLRFDDAGPPIPQSVVSSIPSGTYSPTDYGFATDNFPAPAPAGPYGRELSFFEFINPNGAWSLYVVDDISVDAGSIGGWSLQLTTLDPLADVGIQMTESQDPVNSGAQLTYTINVANHGPSTATGVFVEQNLPASAQLISSNPSQGSCVFDDGTLTCELGNLSNQGTATITVVVRPTQGGILVSTATVGANESDQVEENDDVVTVTTVKNLADLELTQAVAPSPVLLGEEIVYTIALTNRGPSTATAVQLADTLPGSLVFTSVTASQGSCTNNGGTVTCALGTLPVGAGAGLTLVARTTVIGGVTNTISLATGESDVVPGNEVRSLSATVEPAADLLVSTTVSPGSGLVGEPLFYDIAVSNRGPSIAHGVVLSDLLPGGVTLSGTLSSQGSCTNNGGTVLCDLGLIAAGSGAVVTLEVVPSGTGTMTNLATVAAVEGDPSPGDNIFRTITQVDPAADLAIGILDSVDPLPLTDDLSYTLFVTNLGPSTATGVRVVDPLPGNVTFLSALASQGSCTNAGGVVTCELGSLAMGATAEVIIVIKPTATGGLTNVVTISGNEADLDPGNSQATEITRVLVASGVFGTGEIITISAAGMAVPYPSTVLVEGIDVRVDKVSVTLSNLTHSYADDLDLLLVSPLGDSVMIWSDVGGGSVLSNLSVLIADDAEGSLPDSGPVVDGRYSPTDHDPASDMLPAPAPPGPYGSSLEVFNRKDPNGFWSLYVFDDSEKDSGVLAGGWSLTFSTLTSIADLGVSVASPPLVAPSSNHTFSVTVTNVGPSSALDVGIANILPVGAALVSANASQGSCSNDMGTVRCALLDLALHQTVTVDLVVTFPTLGLRTNRVSVSTSDIDQVVGNNAAVSVVSVVEAVNFVVQPVNRTVSSGAPASLSAEVRGATPYRYQWRLNGVDIPGATNLTYSLGSAQFSDQGVYTLLLSNEVSARLSNPATLTVLSAPIITLEPVSTLSLAGRLARLEVEAVGTLPLGYQWFRGGTELLADATNKVLFFPNVTKASNGGYHVVVSNGQGATVSQTATLTVTEVDFGDAPDPGYPTRLASDGASHEIVEGVHLGAAVDFEPEARASSNAQGDDTHITDDEDGVVFTSPVLAGQLATLEVTASTNLLLDAWFDFDRNGSWNEPGEQIFTNQPLVVGAANALAFRVPGGGNPGASFARFRASTAGGLGTTGRAPDGEVEDYGVTILGVADLAVTVQELADPVPLGSSITYIITVTNMGPSRATVVTVTDVLPSGANLGMMSASQGSCTVQSGVVSCSLGSIAVGAGATVQVSAIPTVVGNPFNTVTVSGPEIDLVPANNMVVEVTGVLILPSIATHPQSQSIAAGGSATLTVSGLGSQPLSYQWRRNGVDLPGETNAVLNVTNAAVGQTGSYTVRVSNPVGSLTSLAATLTVGNAPVVVTLPVGTVAATGAVMRATIHPGSLGTTGWFQWGPTTNYGSITPMRSAGAGGVAVAFNDVATGLTPGVTYHYRVAATNLAGVRFGEDRTFMVSVDAPEITSITRQGGGSIRIEFMGMAGRSYAMEGSPDLDLWAVVGAPTDLGGGRFEYIDLDGAPIRFYRVLAP